jgi:hypothetical protein
MPNITNNEAIVRALLGEQHQDWQSRLPPAYDWDLPASGWHGPETAVIRKDASRTPLLSGDTLANYLAARRFYEEQLGKTEYDQIAPLVGRFSFGHGLGGR